MKLEDYLKGIRNCPDEKIEFTDSAGKLVEKPKLTAEFGVYDNFPVFLKVKNFPYYLRELQTLNEFGELTIRDSEIIDGRQVKIAESSLIQVQMCIMPWLEINFIPGDGNEDEKTEILRRTCGMADYNTTIVLHPTKNEGSAKPQTIRNLAAAIEAIGEHALKNRIPIFLPKSIAWCYPHDDYSRIAFFNPEE